MKSNWIKAVAFVAVALLIAPAVFAQTTGRIEGRVVSEGEALPGVTVQITSTALQGERIAVTDADGRFRFLALAPGDYNLRASLEGFTTLEQQDISVRLDRTVTLQLTMTSAFGEEVTVSGIAPIIDTTSTTSGASFDERLFNDLPTTRTFTGLAFQAPGVVGGGLGANPSIGGASAAENRYVIDGLDTTDPAFGTIGATVPQEFVREVEVKTGGYEAEYGGALGGFVNVITKSGGNELEGDLFGYYTDDSLQETAPAVATVGEQRGFEEYDFGAALGGKLIQDKLWYFVAANPAYEDTFITTRGGIDDTEEQESLFYSGKLTWQLNPNHQLVGSVFGDPEEENDTIINAYGRLGTNDDFGSNNYGLTYNGTIGASNFVELSAGTYDLTSEADPYVDNPRYDAFTGDPSLRQLVADNAPCGSLDPFYSPFSSFSFSTECTGATFRIDSNDRSRDEFRGSWTWFGETGTIDHEIKVGGSVRSVEYTDAASYPGRDLRPFFDSNGTLVDDTGLRGQRIRLFSGDPNDTYQFIEYQQDSVGETDEEAIYLQDSVRFSDYFTVNLGVRADSFNSTGEGSDDLGPSGGLPRELDFSFSDMIAPRLGFTWDVFQNGRSKLYGHFGRFYESVPLDINVRAFGEEIFNFFIFSMPTDGAGNVVLPTRDNPGTILATVPLGTGTGVDPNIDPMYTEEYQLGFEYEVIPNVAAGVKYISRSIENVIEDISVNGGISYFITNPGGQSFTEDPVLGGPVLDDITGEVLDSVTFPEPVRDYEAIELTLNKRFSNNWQMYGSLVWSENKGNYGGLFRQDNGQLDPNITSLYDLPSLLEGANGLLPNDREYQVKVYGSYVWNFGLTTGFNFQWLDGTPISKLGAHEIYGGDERFVTQRGSAGRTPDVWDLDISFQYPIRFGNGSEFKLIADVFNVTDESEATTVDQTWTFDAPSAGDPATDQTNPNWGEPTSFQTPRTIRLGAKFSF